MDSMVGADLASMMADPFFTVAISIGSSSTRGLFDQQDELIPDAVGGQAQVRSNVVTIKKGSLAGIAIDAAITVDGTNYKVREQALSDDGLLQHIKVA